MDKTIVQNIDWIDTNQYELENWLDIHSSHLSLAVGLRDSQLPISPMAHLEFLEKF
jgi:hypothetical protein